MKRALWVGVVALVWELSLVGLAQRVPPGFDAASFARLGLGARAMSMAGAYVAVAEGAVAGYWNPAGLATLSEFQVEGMYTNWLGADIHYQYISIGGFPMIGEQRPTLHLGDHPVTFGLTWLSVGVTGIPWWDEEGGYGTFDAWSHLMILSVAVPVSQTPFLAIGGSLKLYHDRVLEGQSLGWGGDIGVLWRTQVGGVPLQLGVCTTDLGGTKVRWYGTTGEPENYVPWIMRVGLAADFPVWEGYLGCAVSYEWGLDRPRFDQVRVGSEMRLGWLALRAGWDQPLWQEPKPSPDSGFERAPGRWCAGIGISPWEGMTLDYAFLPSKLGDSHLVALRVSF